MLRVPLESLLALEHLPLLLQTSPLLLRHSQEDSEVLAHLAHLAWSPSPSFSSLLRALGLHE